MNHPTSRGRRATAMAAALLGAALAGTSVQAQTTPRPQLYVVRNVRVNADPEAASRTLVLSAGRIERWLDEGAQLPAGAREVDAEGALAIPAFVDAFTATGCATPVPKPDQDLPPSERSEVLVDMREANRKGIQPAFRAADVLDFPKDKAKAWREAGFGAALSAPRGQLLAGSSALLVTREAAPRDAMLAPEVFAHAAFDAGGPGYPSTLMGYMAQLRQFFLDARYQSEIVRRWEAGRPGPRPPRDVDLEAVLPLLEGRRRLLCEADSARDIERWIALADEHGLAIAIAGGREAWRVADVLAARRIPVVLTLDWGEEPKDPHEKEKKEKEKQEKAQPAKEPDAGEEKPEPPAPAEPEPPSGGDSSNRQEESPAPQEPKPKPGKEWEYEEPLGVREERRRLWEEGRDCAIRLHEKGVAFAFGSGGSSAQDLLKKVRTLVEQGLPADAALAALTLRAAEILGAERHLGSLEAGRDATFALWTADPLAKAEKGAGPKLAWLFVDGFPHEFDLEKDAGEKGKPDEGVSAAGEWELEIQRRQGTRPATLKLEMDEQGAVTGTVTSPNPRGEGEQESEARGHVSGKTLILRWTISMGEREMESKLTATLEGDALEGEIVTSSPFGESSSTVSGKRTPKQGEEIR
jgi:hypothetical protein